ncbi:Replication protein A 70 kDa DNA-binding subunit B [Rhynchospora pubera]|uniref:Replication protein A 70 kDa DNA-binding subunit B n=1 Tax=Rhynchospora pubera TaxID=906938 RepID=A0AAV8G8K7_9POAL|nr:Replication protein A 70 kDa DNA-binding subunit B [Rhynchospora pubera]
MTSPIPVSTLTMTTDIQRARIHGRPIRIWPASDPRRGRVWKLNFLLLDHVGGKIQGIIFANEYQRISTAFAEHNIVEITRFAIDESTKDYQVVDYDYMLKITRQTQVKTLSPNLYQIPTYHFDFKRLEDVGTEITYEKAVLDTIARIVGFSAVRVIASQGNARVQTLYLMNERGFTIDVALWVDFIDKFDIADLYEKSKTSPVAVACNSLQIKKDFNGVYSLKTYTGTRFHFDSAMKEISDYIQQTPYDGKAIVLEATPEMFSRPGPSLSLLPKRDPIKITLQELNALYLDNFTESLYQCAVRIVRITDPFDWCYEACTECRRKLEHDEQGYYCTECRIRRRHSTSWYRVRIQVKDHTDVAQFIVLGKTAQMIIGTDAPALKAQQDEDSDHTPQALLNIVNKTYLFTVSGKQPGQNRKYRNYTVCRHEPVPDNMIDLLPEPVLFLQDTPPHPQNTSISSETPIVHEPPTEIPITPLTNPLETEKVIGKRRLEDSEGTSVVPIKSVRRRLEDDLSAQTTDEQGPDQGSTAGKDQE